MKFSNNDFQNLKLNSLPTKQFSLFVVDFLDTEIKMTTQFDEFKNFLQRVQLLNMSPNDLNQPEQQSSAPEYLTTTYLNLPPKPQEDQLIFDDEKEMTNIKVTVGIDEDLKMILEMDPSIMDLGDGNLDQPKVLGLPPITGG